jgi:hypothetical protein
MVPDRPVSRKAWARWRRPPKCPASRQLALPGAVSDITTSNGTSLFLVEGVPYGCGVDLAGTIGDGETNDKATPTVASELLTRDFTSRITGAEQSAGVAEGEVYTWGSGTERRPRQRPVGRL